MSFSRYWRGKGRARPSRAPPSARRAAAPNGISVVDQHELFAVLAVQGPRSTELLTSLGLPTGHDYMSFTVSAYEGTDVVVCRTGYTGEHGYELVVPSHDAHTLWDAI